MRSEWRYVSSDMAVREWETIPHMTTCVIEIAFPDATRLRFTAVTREWLERQFDAETRWAAFGPLLVLNPRDRSVREELEAALSSGHVHSYFRVRR